jgi:DNA-binding NarL/FixJ family response regulator
VRHAARKNDGDGCDLEPVAVSAAIRVLIADDQDIIREAFGVILNAQADIDVIAEAGDGRSALEQARRLRPDVVLADIRMPLLDGLGLTRQLAGPGVPDPIAVVVVTTFDLDEYVYTALENGACGFLLKRSSPTLLVEAVRAAAGGEALISPQVTLRLIAHLRQNRCAAGSSSSAGAAVRLTPREREIVVHVAHGATNSEIAQRLFISPGTAKNHLATIQAKIGARNRVAVAVWAWNNDLAG